MLTATLALIDGIALLEELAIFIILCLYGLLDLPLMTQGRKLSGALLAALGAGLSFKTGDGAGGVDCFTGLPVMRSAFRAGISRSGAFYDVIDVICSVTLLNGYVLVAVGDGDRIAALKSQMIGAIGIVIEPIGDGTGGAGGGVIIVVGSLIEDLIALDLGQLTVVANDTDVAGEGGGTGGHAADGGGVVIEVKVIRLNDIIGTTVEVMR